MRRHLLENLCAGLTWFVLLFGIAAFYDFVLSPWLGIPTLSHTTNRWCQEFPLLIVLGAVISVVLWLHCCMGFWPFRGN
jgi:hypothetical protein